MHTWYPAAVCECSNEYQEKALPHELPHLAGIKVTFSHQHIDCNMLYKARLHTVLLLSPVNRSSFALQSAACFWGVLVFHRGKRHAPGLIALSNTSSYTAFVDTSLRQVHFVVTFAQHVERVCGCCL